MRLVPRSAALLALLLAATPLAPRLLAQEAATPPPESSEEAAPAAPEAPPPTFAAEVEQVIVDVVVTDKKGNPVAGLGRDDMTVLEDGKPQEVVSFEAVALPDEPAAEPPPPPPVSTNVGTAAAPGRTFVILFDDMHLTPFRARDAKAAVASFLENGVREGDRVSLIATSGSAWWTTRMASGRDKLIDILKRLDGRYIPDSSPERLSDWEAMRIHVYRDPQVTAQVMRRFDTYGVTMLQQRDTSNPLNGTVDDPFVSSRASEVYFSSRTRNRLTLEVLERALNGLAGARGRKSVILVSEGFIYDPNLDEFKRVNAASRRANAAIYFVNAKGLDAMPMGFGAEFGPALPSQDVGYAFTSNMEQAAGSESLAADSGGFSVRNTNDLESGIQRIAKETRVYYLLGYISSNPARDGRFREIEVKLGDGKGLKVRARKGYYAPSDEGRTALGGKEGVDPVVQAALDSPWPQDDIPLRMTHYVGGEKMLGKASVLVVAEVDVRGLHFEEKDGRSVAEIDFLMVVAHRESGEFFRYDQSVTLRLRPSTRARLERLWFPIPREFELRPGDHQAKIVVREKASGQVGTVTHEFEVPPLDAFRVSTPILSDVSRPAAAGEAPHPIALARREFAEGANIFCQFEVFGAARDPATGMPRVLQGWAVTADDGTALNGRMESLITPTSLGGLTRLIGFPLKGAPPGGYEMVMTFRDEVSGKVLERREPFTVVPAPPEPALDETPPDDADPVASAAP
jgi:VWFA-related protein